MKGESFRDFVLDQLEECHGVSWRPMFGAAGLYRSGIFFGIISDGRLYFKTNDDSRVEYINRGMHPFRASEKQTLITYYEVPVDIIEDRTELAVWAERASCVAGRE